MKKSVVELPPHIDTGTFVNDLGSYFDQKVMKICDRIHSGLGEQCSTRNVPSDNSNAGLQHMFCQFKSLAENDVKNLVMKSNQKTCGSDPMPTKFVVDSLSHKNNQFVYGKWFVLLRLEISAGYKPLLKKAGIDLQF